MENLAQPGCSFVDAILSFRLRYADISAVIKFSMHFASTMGLSPSKLNRTCI